MPLPDRYSINDYSVAAALPRHPAWIVAYDEEGVEGQDETTIKPNELREPSLPGYATVDVTFHNGQAAKGLLGSTVFGVGPVEEMDDFRLYHDGVMWEFELALGRCEQGWPREEQFYTAHAGLLPMRITAPLSAVFGSGLADLDLTVNRDGSVVTGVPG